MPRAVLLDVFETILTVDFGAVLDGLANATGVSRQSWKAGLDIHRSQLLTGAASPELVFADVLHQAGEMGLSAPSLVQLDDELLLRHAKVFPDVLPFLDAVRDRAVGVALVSNCSGGTRALLDALGLTARVQATVLSCEVGIVKPDPGIYAAAAERLGVSPRKAVFVDDEAAFCAGAEAVGMSAIHIDRGRGSGASASSLLEVLTVLDGPE